MLKTSRKLCNSRTDTENKGCESYSRPDTTSWDFIWVMFKLLLCFMFAMKLGFKWDLSCTQVSLQILSTLPQKPHPLRLPYGKTPMASRLERIAAWLKKVDNQKNLARFTGDFRTAKRGNLWTKLFIFCLGVCVCVCDQVCCVGCFWWISIVIDKNIIGIFRFFKYGIIFNKFHIRTSIGMFFFLWDQVFRSLAVANIRCRTLDMYGFVCFFLWTYIHKPELDFCSF